jgi:outer membrane protein TolC
MSFKLKKIKRLPFIVFLIFLSSCSIQTKAYKSIEKDNAFTYKTWEKQNSEVKYLDDNLSLEKAVLIAYNHNKKNLALNEKKYFAKAKVLESVSTFLPQIEALGAYTYLDSHAKLQTAAGNLKIGKKENVSLTLQATQPIFNGGALISNFKANRYNSFIINENILSSYQKLYFDVAKSYYDILLSVKIFEVYENSLNAAKKHFEEAKQKFENGLISDYDLLRAEVEYTNLNANVIKQKNKVSVFKTTFLKFLGMNNNFSFELKDVLEFKDFHIDEKEIIKTAFLSRPDLKAKHFEVESQKQLLNLARSNYLPKINLQVAQRWGAEDANIVTPDKWAKDLSARVFLKWDIFDFGTKRSKIRQQSALLREKKYMLEDTIESINLEIKQAILNFTDSVEFVNSQKLDLKRAKKAYELAECEYKEGLKSQIDLLDALSSMTNSQSLYYQSLYQQNLALMQLKLVMGILKGDEK